MGTKGEALAKQFEAKAQEATSVLETLSDADWKKVTSAEKWPVGVTAHHMAMAHPVLAGIVQAIAAGNHTPTLGADDINAMNARHARDYASVGKSETLALHRKNAADAAAIVRSLDDAALARSGMPLKGLPVMTAEQLAAGVLIGHIAEHLASIRATVGR